MRYRQLPKFLSLSLTLALAGQMPLSSGQDLGASEPPEGQTNATTQVEASLEASAEALYSASNNLLDRQLHAGVEGGILEPFCKGNAPSDQDGFVAACDALRPEAYR